MLYMPERALKAPGSADRCLALESTLAMIPLIRERYGITRIADATHLDRSGIPTISAIVPESPDLLSVYNGKGLTLEAARCSAVMEAFERQVAAVAPSGTFTMPVREIQEQFDLETMGLRPKMRDRIVECVNGTDLLTGATVAVPLALVQCPWFGDRLFKVTSTNGLASGNNLTEALYHALCELIERHTWSMYHARSHLLPQTFFGGTARDAGIARSVKFPTGCVQVDRLAARVEAAGLHLRVLYLDEPPLPPTMVATTLEAGSEAPMLHMGFGCSLSPSHAVVRALTEAIQSRIVDIQGAREDIVRAGDPKTNMLDHARRASALPEGRWYFDVPAADIALAAVPDHASDDLAVDLAEVLRRLQATGVGQVVAVDLSPPDIPLHVVRVIVPDLEKTVIDGRIGRRIQQLLNPFRMSA